MSKTRCACAAILLAIATSPLSARADVAVNIAGFTDENTKGYLSPLYDSFASAMSDGLFSSAQINAARPYVRLDLRAMIVRFGDDDRSYMASPEDYFPGTGTYEVPTAVGSSEGRTITDPNTNAQFTFPGGLDLDGLPLAVPQLVVGGFAGTEGILRFFTAELGDSDLGDVSLFGIGARHSISRYLPPLPIDLAGMVFYQTFNMGDDLVDFRMLSFGVQASRRFTFFEPYAGVGIDRSSMSADYEFTGGGASERLSVEFDDQTNAHLTLGAALRMLLVHVNAEVNISEQTSYALGLSLGI